MTIIGSNFTGATAVSFGGTPATSFAVNSATQITAFDPAESAGTINVTRHRHPGGTSAIVVGDQYTYIALPAVGVCLPMPGRLRAVHR